MEDGNFKRVIEVYELQNALGVVTFCWLLENELLDKGSQICYIGTIQVTFSEPIHTAPIRSLLDQADCYRKTPRS